MLSNLNKIVQAAGMIAFEKGDELCFMKNCEDLDLDPHWLYTTWKSKKTNLTFKIIGLRKIRKIFMLIVQIIKPIDAVYVFSIKEFLTDCEQVN